MDLGLAAGYAFNALRRRHIRSWLTISGVIVGIAAIVLLVGLVEGLRGNILEQLESFGSRTIIVIPTNIGGQTAISAAASSFMPTSGKLYMNDYERVKRIPEIAEVTPVILGRTYVVYKDKTITASIFGIEPSKFQETLASIEIEKGRFLTDTDRNAAVLGYDIAEDGFDEEVQLGGNLYIGDERHKVIGILKKTGNTVANIDTAIYISFDKAEDMFADVLAEDEISAMRIIVRDDVNITAVADEIEEIMLASHRVAEDEADFGVVTPESISQQVESVTSMLSLFLGAIAGISLLVGGVGIANTMFMSVLERRREIGILKSVGSKERDILMLFLIESSFIGIGGGFLGMTISFFFAFLLGLLGVTVVISMQLMLLAIVFSALVGIISGSVPAYRAAKLDPVEALRSR